MWVKNNEMQSALNSIYIFKTFHEDIYFLLLSSAFWQKNPAALLRHGSPLCKLWWGTVKVTPALGSFWNFGHCSGRSEPVPFLNIMLYLKQTEKATYQAILFGNFRPDPKLKCPCCLCHSEFVSLVRKGILYWGNRKKFLWEVVFITIFVQLERKRVVANCVCYLQKHTGSQASHLPAESSGRNSEWLWQTHCFRVWGRARLSDVDLAADSRAT